MIVTVIVLNKICLNDFLKYNSILRQDRHQNILDYNNKNPVRSINSQLESAELEVTQLNTAANRGKYWFSLGCMPLYIRHK